MSQNWGSFTGVYSAISELSLKLLFLDLMSKRIKMVNNRLVIRHNKLPSNPNELPVSQDAPLIFTSSKGVCGAKPLTETPKSAPWLKFHRI